LEHAQAVGEGAVPAGDGRRVSAGGSLFVSGESKKDACFRNSETIAATGVMKVVLKDAATAERPSPGTLFVSRSVDVSL
jgi:non-ribosomal peptide synthetase component E (peptide arylation enzyme)